MPFYQFESLPQRGYDSGNAVVVLAETRKDAEWEARDHLSHCVNDPDLPTRLCKKDYGREVSEDEWFTGLACPSHVQVRG